MAKLSCNNMQKTRKTKIDEFNSPIVFVLDMCNGLLKEGALSDPSIMYIVDDIKSLLDKIHPSIFACDSHDLDAREFDSTSIHCVRYSEESKVIDELLPYAKTIYYKNATNPFVCEDIQLFVRDQIHQYRDIIVVGCCSDVGILQFALSMNAYINQKGLYEHRVIVPINMIETYHIDGLHDSGKWNQVACDMMLANDIDVVEIK